MSKFSLEKLKGERSKVLVMVYLDGQSSLFKQMAYTARRGLVNQLSVTRLLAWLTL